MPGVRTRAVPVRGPAGTAARTGRATPETRGPGPDAGAGRRARARLRLRLRLRLRIQSRVLERGVRSRPSSARGPRPA
ncbi:hypothetical protein CRI70_27095 [Streptomyces sp. Ru87]|nr:hypothetical protein CRI70_27095 [Streptomyces sp. Ru87]